MTRRHLPAFLLALGLAGCGPTVGKPGPPTPHNGVLVDMPDGKGYVEVLKQVTPGKAGRSSLVLYFLDRDRNAITPAPTAATFKGKVTRDKPIPLKPGGGTEAGALVSDPIDDRGEIEGELTATIGGGPVIIPILIR